MWTAVIILLGAVALVLIFRLVKSLLKLVLAAVALLLVLAGIWYVSERNPEAASSVRRVGEEATEKLKKAAGEAMEGAAVAVEAGRSETVSTAVGKAREGVGKALEAAAQAVRGDGEGAAAPPGEAGAGDVPAEADDSGEEPRDPQAPEPSEAPGAPEPGNDPGVSE